MLSHIADETRSLAHGFLGALFSVILVVSDTGHMSIVVCCLCLYSLFIVITSILHFVLKSRVEKEMTDIKYGATITFLTVFSVIGWVGCLAAFGFNVAPDYLYIAKPEALRVGIIIYGAFLFVMAVSHLNIMKASRGVSQND